MMQSQPAIANASGLGLREAVSITYILNFWSLFCILYEIEKRL